jgi:hypothetical protein
MPGRKELGGAGVREPSRHCSTWIRSAARSGGANGLLVPNWNNPRVCGGTTYVTQVNMPSHSCISITLVGGPMPRHPMPWIPSAMQRIVHPARRVLFREATLQVAATDGCSLPLKFSFILVIRAHANLVDFNFSWSESHRCNAYQPRVAVGMMSVNGSSSSRNAK